MLDKRWTVVAMTVGMVWAASQSYAAPAKPAAKKTQATPTSVNMCVSPDVAGQLDQCPDKGPQWGKLSGQTAPRTVFQGASVRKQTKDQKDYKPGFEIDMSARRNRAQTERKQRALLLSEAQILERLIQNTPATSARRPDVLLRAAETYFELQQDSTRRTRALDEPIFKARSKKDQNRVKQMQQQQVALEKETARWRQEALRKYAILVRDHKNYPRMDEVLFSLAFGLEEMGQFDQAREVYYRLIKEHPKSRFIPNAYLSFAEYYFAQGQMADALKFYQKVNTIPAEQNAVFGYALYKQAWCYYNLENFKGSMDRFVEVIRFATGHPEARDGKNLARQALREIVLPYSQVGSPKQALSYFLKIAPDRGQAIEMLESLAELYFDTGQWASTIEVYQKLIAERPSSDRVCYWQGRITDAVISSRPKPEQVAEGKQLIDVYKAFMRTKHSAQSKTECKQATAGVLFQLATAWHREAVGTAQQAGTKDRNTMRLAAQLYDRLVIEFPDIQSLKFPDIARKDWPNHYRIAYYRAELLWKMEDWRECGPAFDRVVEMNPKGEFVSDAAYAAVLCYNNSYQQLYKQTERVARGAASERKKGKEVEKEEVLEPKPLGPLEMGMLKAFQRYICYVNDSDKLPTIKYRRARIYYEANHFEEAAVLFKDVAWNHRDSELAEYAANLYLDSLILMAEKGKPKRVGCYSAVEETLDPLEKWYCATPDAEKEHGVLCDRTRELRCNTLRKKAETLQVARDYKGAASAYVGVYRRFHAHPDQCGGKMDEVLWNAALNFEAARLLGRAIRVRSVLIERFPDSSLSKKAIYLVGANYHALAFYERAAEYYENFAKKFPGEDESTCSKEDRATNTCAIAHEALKNAVFFRLGLGQEDKALDDVRLFQRNYGASASKKNRRVRDAAQVGFSIGSIYERSKDWSKVVDHYRSWLRQYSRFADPHQVIQAYVIIGNAYRNAKDAPKADASYATAIREWGKGTERKIAALQDTSKEDKERYGMMARDAVSEARFYLAESLYRAFQRIKFPEYKGGRSIADVNQWAQRDFKRWLDSKRDALLSAERAYNQIADLKVPKWEIAAAARVGEMYSSFIDAFREAPVPKEIENDDELYGVYVDALEAQAKTFEKPAVEKFEFCLITATRVRWFSEFSKQCESELNRLNPREYPLAAELRGEAGYAHSTVSLPGMVELSE
jgi:tetratricopeptide (TPR) repeat protein